MRPPARIFQLFSLLIGAIALVLSSAGLVGASPVEGEDAPGNSASAVPEHAAEKQGGPDRHDEDTVGDPDGDEAEVGESAHPSGKDRSVEPGGSGDQGNAPSDPDDDGNGPDRTNGGADKPGGSGGVDLADQDGNNGCGNDQDFEDDNEGLCLGPDGAPGQQVDDDEGSNPDDDTNTGGDIDVDDDNEVNDDEGSNVGGADKVTVCHATGSETNPYVLITVSVNSILNPAGHGDHADDIIPPFEGFDGQGDVDLIADGCEVDTGVDNDNEVDDDEGNNVGGADKVTICHATGSATNPYVLITVSENAVLTEGHDGHDDDVIPPFGDYPGKNFDGDLIAADCELDAETPENPGTPENPDTPETPAKTPEVPVETPDVEDEGEEVGGEVVVNIPTTPATPTTPTVIPATPASPAVQTVADRTPQVLGSQVTRTSQLPRTGDETTNLVPFGLALVLLGFGLQRTSKRFGAARAS